jgi:hypothetical protein
MIYTIKKQVPYICIATIMTYMYQYGIDGSLIWYKALLTIPITFASFWLYKMIIPKQESFSIRDCLERYGSIIILFTGFYALINYYQNKTINIIAIALTGICFCIAIILLEHSLYD